LERKLHLLSLPPLQDEKLNAVPSFVTVSDVKANVALSSDHVISSSPGLVLVVLSAIFIAASVFMQV
jgi:hypothetical protein